MGAAVKFRSETQLLDSIRREHDAFLAVAASIPPTRYSEEGVWGDGWTIKDLFAHVTEWEQLFLGWYRQGLAGKQPARPAVGYNWSQTPELNRAIWRKHKGRSWSQVHARFHRSYKAILALATSLTERQLLDPGHFRWTAKLPLASYLGPNSCSHYRTATKILKRWLRQQRAAGEGQ
jgi:hypothetical protein